MLALHREYEATVAQITQYLCEADLRVVRTFDLKAACAEHPGGVCPHHGTAPCNCQLSVLLVYGQAANPITLTVHHCDGQTWLSLVNGPQQQADPLLETRIVQALAPGSFLVER